MSKTLLAVGNDAKTVKGQKIGYLTGILYLAPGDLSGREFCPNRTPGCSADCLFTAGRGVMAPVYAGRMRKSRLFLDNPPAFVYALAKDVERVARKAYREHKTPLVRLNGTSDLPWENLRGLDGYTIMQRFPMVQFYDYTKSLQRMSKFLDGGMPTNYHLTFSRSEENDAACVNVLARGGNVAVVFSTRKGQALPLWWHGYQVIDGDVSDVRHAEQAQRGQCGVVVGLRAKGKARKSRSGFVVVAS